MYYVNFLKKLQVIKYFQQNVVKDILNQVFIKTYSILKYYLTEQIRIATYSSPYTRTCFVPVKGKETQNGNDFISTSIKWFVCEYIYIYIYNKEVL